MFFDILITVKAVVVPAATSLLYFRQANGDFWFRAAVSEDIGIDWGYEYHQDSFNYGTPAEVLLQGGARDALCQVLSLWIPLVPVDAQSGCLSLVKGSHKQGKIPWEGPVAGWPDGVEQYGTDVCAEAMEPGDGTPRQLQ